MHAHEGHEERRESRACRPMRPYPAGPPAPRRKYGHGYKEKEREKKGVEDMLGVRMSPEGAQASEMHWNGSLREIQDVSFTFPVHRKYAACAFHHISEHMLPALIQCTIGNAQLAVHAVEHVLARLPRRDVKGSYAAGPKLLHMAEA